MLLARLGGLAMRQVWQHWALARWLRAGCAVVLASATSLMAQDITLTSRNGAFSVSGNLNSYDGEFFRLSSDVGPLTVLADSVTCDGPACPDLSTPKAMIRLTGDGEVGAAVLPGLIAAFAKERGFLLRPPKSDADATRLVQPGTDAVLAEFFFTPRPPEAARSALADAVADLVITRFAPLDSEAKLMALDALVPIVSPENPIPRLSTTQLAAALSGEMTNWSQIGGPDMPIVLHGMDKASDLSAALAARLGQPVVAARIYPDAKSLGAGVAGDPWALAMTGRTAAGAARILPLTDSCGFALEPGPLSVKTDDYPLTLPVFVLTPPRRLPLITREFLDFLAMPAAQSAIAKAGFVARDFERAALGRDSTRLINAIQATPDADGLQALQQLIASMQTYDRASVTLRFEDGGTDLDLRSIDALNDLALHITSGLLAKEDMVLMGFVPKSGAREAEIDASQKLSEAVLAQLKLLAPDIPDARWPRAEGVGAALPLACDTTPAGKRLNRRVELWLRRAVAP
jgi:phosphate transport system substrate-binding protein